MRVTLNTIALFLIAIFFMYQDTPANPKTSGKTKSVSASAQTSSPNISYTVSMSQPWTHLLEVEMRLGVSGSDVLN